MMEYYKDEVYKKDVETALSSIINAERLKNKRVLVTGASGLIGSFIADVLLQAGGYVFVAGRNKATLNERFPGANVLQYDLAKEIEFDESFDYIIHAAGYGHPAAFREDPVGILLNSVNGTAQMLNYAIAHDVKRFLYVSSGEVYGSVNSASFRACYPIGKQAGENLCASFFYKYGLDTVIARLCHIFGPGASEQDNRATAQFFRNAKNKEDIVLKSKGEQRRSYLYVADSASAILTLLTTGESGKSYDIASDDSIITIAELADSIAKLAGVKVVFDLPNDIEKQEQTPINEQVLDGEELTKLGWKSRYNLSEGVADTLSSVEKTTKTEVL